MAVPRPEEVGDGAKSNQTQTVVEGNTEFTQVFVKSVETEIILDKKFTLPGYVYNLKLVRY